MNNNFTAKIIEIFYLVYEFWKQNEPELGRNPLGLMVKRREIALLR